MIRYMLDTNICIYVIKKRPESLRERFNRLADQMPWLSYKVGLGPGRSSSILAKRTQNIGAISKS